MTQTSDKRGAQRAPMGTKVSWSMDGHQWHDDSSKDISSTGMMLLTQKPVELNSTIKLRFKLPNLKLLDPIVAKAKVVRSVNRNDRQLGIGLHFISLKSHNYKVVQEFVCRILGVAMDDVIGDGSLDGSVGYSLKMERFAREAAFREEKAYQKKMAQEEALRKQENMRLWGWRVFKAVLIALPLFGVYKFGFFLLELAAWMQDATQ